MTENCSSLIPQEHIYVHKVSFGTLLSIAPFVFLYTFVLATAVISSGLFVFWAYRKFGLSFVFSTPRELGSRDDQRRADSPTLLSFIDNFRKKLLNGLGEISTQNPRSILNSNSLEDRVNFLRVEIKNRLDPRNKKKNFNPRANTLDDVDSADEGDAEIDDADLGDLMSQIDEPIELVGVKSSENKLQSSNIPTSNSASDIVEDESK